MTTTLENLLIVNTIHARTHKHKQKIRRKKEFALFFRVLSQNLSRRIFFFFEPSSASPAVGAHRLRPGKPSLFSFSRLVGFFLVCSVFSREDEKAQLRDGFPAACAVDLGGSVCGALAAHRLFICLADLVLLSSFGLRWWLVCFL